MKKRRNRISEMEESELENLIESIKKCELTIQKKELANKSYDKIGEYWKENMRIINPIISKYLWIAFFVYNTRNLLDEKKKNMQELANYLGINKSTLSKILSKTDPVPPSATQVYLIAEYFSVSLDFLLGKANKHDEIYSDVLKRYGFSSKVFDSFEQIKNTMDYTETNFFTQIKSENVLRALYESNSFKRAVYHMAKYMQMTIANNPILLKVDNNDLEPIIVEYKKHDQEYYYEYESMLMVNKAKATDYFSKIYDECMNTFWLQIRRKIDHDRIMRGNAETHVPCDYKQRYKDSISLGDFLNGISNDFVVWHELIIMVPSNFNLAKELIGEGESLSNASKLVYVRFQEFLEEEIESDKNEISDFLIFSLCDFKTVEDLEGHYKKNNRYLKVVVEKVHGRDIENMVSVTYYDAKLEKELPYCKDYIVFGKENTYCIGCINDTNNFDIIDSLMLDVCFL